MFHFQLNSDLSYWSSIFKQLSYQQLTSIILKKFDWPEYISSVLFVDRSLQVRIFLLFSLTQEFSFSFFLFHFKCSILLLSYRNFVQEYHSQSIRQPDNHDLFISGLVVLVRTIAQWISSTQGKTRQQLNWQEVSGSLQDNYTVGQVGRQVITMSWRIFFFDLLDCVVLCFYGCLLQWSFIGLAFGCTR